jgi:hypothetical protein
MQFTAQDAQTLAQIAASAPCQHLGVAQERMQLLARFSAWHRYLPTKFTIPPPGKPVAEDSKEAEADTTEQSNERPDSGTSA